MPSAEKKTEALLAGLKGIIWDLDNTLYRFDDDFKHACAVAAAKAAVALGAPLSLKEAIDISWESFYRTGYSMDMFIARYDLDRERMHHSFHKFIDETLLKSSLQTVSLFEQMNLEHCLVTHASGDWARRALSHLGLLPWFAEGRIIALEDIAFAKKAESARPFEEALSRLGMAVADCLVVEDIPENLAIPRALGLKTVLIHHGQPPVPMPVHIDMDFDNAVALLSAVRSAL